MSTLRELCANCGIDAGKLTKVNCIVKLKSASTAKVKIDKFFLKVWHSSGGLLICTCPHGVTYGFKSLLKPESPRDIGDMLLSMKHPPNIVISDIPHMLAGHLNKRCPNFFNPHSGRVVEPTEDNIKLVEDGNFTATSLPWLNRCSEKAAEDLVLVGTDIHPITLVQQRYSLYDRFHEKNTSQ